MNHCDAARRRGTVRPELMTLESREAPGQANLGSAVAMSLFGPAIAAWQMDGLAGGAEVRPIQRAATASNAIAIISDAAEAAEISIVAASAQPAEIAPVQATNPQAGEATQAVQNTGTPGALEQGALATHRAVSRVTIDDPRIMAIRPKVDAQQGGNTSRPVDQLDQSDGDSGSRATIIGPNVLTHNLNNCGGGTGITQSETTIARSGNVVVAAYNDSRGFYGCAPNQVTGWGFSIDRGNTWQQGASLPGGSHAGDPWLATGPDGSIYLAELRTNLTGMQVLKGTPTGSGVTWGSPVTMGTSNVTPDKEAMVVDQNNGNIYISFTRFSGGSGIWMYKSTNGGASFTGPTLITSSSSTQGSVPAIGPNGEVYVAWQNNGGTFGNPTGIGFARSLDFGATFQVIGNVATNTGSVISGTDRSPQFPHIAVDTSGGANNGNIYIAYHSNHLGGGTGSDAVVIRSTNGGTSFSTASRINDDGTSAAQWFPTIDVDNFGFVHSFFYDRRGLTGTNTNLYYARSSTGATSWEPNVKVTASSFNMTTSGADVTPFWGDYINATTLGKQAMVAFAYGINGTPDTFFTRAANRN